VSYTVRDLHEGELVALTPPFVYDVLAEFGADDAGRAIAVRPRHAPHSVYLCFRGVRRVAAERAHEADRCAVVSTDMERRTWLDGLPGARKLTADLRARAGVLAHHDVIYEGHHGAATTSVAASAACATSEAPLSADAPSSSGAEGELEERAHSAGPAQSDNYGATERAQSLQAWLEAHCGGESFEHVVFVGFSLGGALAQITALRAAHELPNLAPRVRVLALGATQWASPALSSTFADTFGTQAVHLLTASPKGAVAHGGTLGGASFESPRESPPSSSDGRALWSLGLTLLDPMTLGFTEQTSYTHNLILCEAPVDAAAQKATPSRADPTRSGSQAHTLQGGEAVAQEPSGGGPPKRPTSGRESGSSAPTLRRGGPPNLRRSAKVSGTGKLAEAVVKQAEAEAPAPAVAALPGPDSRMLTLLGSDERSLMAWPLELGTREGLLSLKRRRPGAAHERAYHSYWAGDIAAHHPFATDVRSLHTGSAYRSALIREHTRLRRWSSEERVEAPQGGRTHGGGAGDSALVECTDSQLPLAMSIDGAWECRAGVIYSYKHSQSGISLVEAKPAPGLDSPKIKRLMSISTAMDELSMC